MAIQEIRPEFWDAISGGNANSNYEGNMGSSKSSRNSGGVNSNGVGSYIAGVRDSCIENIFGGAILGTLGGTPATVAVGAIAGSFTGGCWRPTNSGNGGGGGTGSNNSNCSSGSQCGW